MTVSHENIAAILAATEITPAAWRDLSVLVEKYGPEALLDSVSAPTSRDTLLNFIRTKTDPARVAYWSEEIKTLTYTDPLTRILISTDEDYPHNLGLSYDRPPFICVKGELKVGDSRAISIVGSRLASDPGLEFTRAVSNAAADAGFTVVSGLARGIDTAAHEAALKAGGRTIGVLGSAIDSPTYPPENAELAARITRSGALVSQFRPGSPPTSSSFVARNAVISGMSQVSLVVEAGEASGTRTEAEFAEKQGRSVLLWAPALAESEWAKNFMHQPKVTMVLGVDEVMQALQRSVHLEPIQTRR